ncbi:alpha/beta hydrolase [uncultured Thalassospira sp.]|uniref:alpha/beta fold hydrolase n=1 Tax=uncultured Thalassospira sp. TaxID=404382 RepID=UPI0030DA29E5|tara:strand:+ start:5930 stop:6811 length:882 start_codon:yes stop_codon:yes gene_type:complete
MSDIVATQDAQTPTPGRVVRDVFVNLCGYETRIRQWGTPGKPAIIMVHGLARLSTDFDIVARQLADDYFILCPDILGRGYSAWAQNPDQEYVPGFYAAQLMEMLDHFNIDQCSWIGTSMGGIVGLVVADVAPKRISRILLNDIGPELAQDAVDRIKSYVGGTPEFTSIAEIDAILRTIYAPFGLENDAEWAELALNSTRRLPNGKYAMHYDPRVMAVFRDQIDDYDGWDMFNRLSCPVTLFSGAQSDLVPETIVKKMQDARPDMAVLSLENCGHAPYLNTKAQVNSVKIFLKS